MSTGAISSGATLWQTFREVTLPIIWTGIFGAGLFGFTLAWNEFERTFLVAGATQTLPLEIFRITSASVLRPYVYSLGVLTTLFSFLLIIIFLGLSRLNQRRNQGAGMPTEDGSGVDEPAHLLRQWRPYRLCPL